MQLLILSILFSLSNSQLARPEDDLVLISTLEGTIHAVDKHGKHHWSLNTGRSFTQSYYSTEAFEESTYIITPQGDLITPAANSFTKQTFTIKELVQACPIIKDDQLHIGEKHMRAFLVDSNLGEILASYENLESERIGDLNSNGYIFIGLVDYVYQVFDMNTMELVYNLTYTELFSTSENTQIASIEELDIAKSALAEYGRVTGIHSLKGNEVSQLPLNQAEGFAKLKIEYSENGMIGYILEEDTEDENTYPILISSKIQMLPSGDPQTPENSINFYYLLPFLLLLISLKWLKQSPDEKISKEDKDISTEDLKFTQETANSKTIGSLTVYTNSILGYGSQGTTVFEGLFQNRIVAVKRLLKEFLDEAEQEMSILLKSDRHPNVVTFYAWEEDDIFVYLAFEKCLGTFETLVNIYNIQNKKKRRQALFELNLTILPETLTLMYESAQGLAYLHSLNIVHRDIKPMNILIDENRVAKIADMAASKSLNKNQSSFGTKAHGSAGWQAAEVLLDERKTKAVDIFSLGCTFYYILTRGEHPFGSRVQRDNNILNNSYDLGKVVPEAADLIERMIRFEGVSRPPAEYIVEHCMFWSNEMKLNFLEEISDKMEADGNGSEFEVELEMKCGHLIWKPWDEIVDPEFLINISKYRKYSYTSLKDLLRVVRNKKHHYNELPEELKKKVGEVPDGYFEYWNELFPTLLVTLFKFAEERKEKLLKGFMKVNYLK